jgi:hypothetical protein
MSILNDLQKLGRGFPQFLWKRVRKREWKRASGACCFATPSVLTISLCSAIKLLKNKDLADYDKILAEKLGKVTRLFHKIGSREKGLVPL